MGSRTGNAWGPKQLVPGNRIDWGWFVVCEGDSFKVLEELQKNAYQIFTHICYPSMANTTMLGNVCVVILLVLMCTHIHQITKALDVHFCLFETRTQDLCGFSKDHCSKHKTDQYIWFKQRFKCGFFMSLIRSNWKGHNVQCQAAGSRSYILMWFTVQCSWSIFSKFVSFVCIWINGAC